MSQMKGSKNVSKMAFFLLPLGIAVNFIGGQVATLLNLPIYLDAIGTMVVAALCGPVYSVATALVTGLLMSITSPTNLVYIGNYLAVGLFSGLFAYWGFYKNVWKSCIAGAVVGLFCGVAGSAVTVAVMGGYSASIRGIITAFLAQTFSLSIPVANMLSEISTDILDKIPSAIITYLLVFRIPNKFLLKLPYGNKYIWGAKKEEAKTEQAK